MFSKSEVHIQELQGHQAMSSGRLVVLSFLEIGWRLVDP